MTDFVNKYVVAKAKLVIGDYSKMADPEKLYSGKIRYSDGVLEYFIKWDAPGTTSKVTRFSEADLLALSVTNKIILFNTKDAAELYTSCEQLYGETDDRPSY